MQYIIKQRTQELLTEIDRRTNLIETDWLEELEKDELIQLVKDIRYNVYNENDTTLDLWDRLDVVFMESYSNRSAKQ